MRNRLLREKKTIEIIIRLYCKNSHKTKDKLCSECSELLVYALKKIDNCRFKAEKPVCGKCKIHCYKPGMRQRIKTAMRTTGYRLILIHPVITLAHFIDSIKY